jgi:predicted dienelactone hydrolase
VKRLSFTMVVSLAALCCMTQDPISAAEYDPLGVAEAFESSTEDVTIQDKIRDREIPIRVHLPEMKEAAPVVLFSHGLGGSRKGSSYLGKHWSARGYVAVFMQHLGSDESVWKGVPVHQRMGAMKEAPSQQNTLARFQDVPAVLDQLEKWNEDRSHPFAGRFDMDKVGMAGHSYGAKTTQALSGESFGRAGSRFTDERIKAALVLSPSIPRRGDPKDALAEVKIPWMLMTGRKDDSPIDKSVTPESRMAVYPALPIGNDKYELVLHDGQHSAFSDGRERRGRTARNPNHHRAILALSTAFWDSHLCDDVAACKWLHGAQVRRVLEVGDRWLLSSKVGPELPSQ